MKRSYLAAGVSTVESLEPRMLMSVSGPSLTVANLDVVPGSERMVFNRVQRQPPAPEKGPTGTVTQPPNNVVHDKATLRLGNNGNATLNISSMAINGPWKIINSPAKTIAPGGTVDIQIQFVAQSAPKYTYNQTNGPFNPKYAGAYTGSLMITTNDPNHKVYTEQLAGWWQDQSEASEEPSLQTMINLIFNYKTNINSSLVNVLPEPNNKRVLFGEEVLSYYWKAANASQPVYVRSLGSWHMQGSPVVVGWYPQGQRNGSTIFTTAGVSGQSFLPGLQGNVNAPAQGTFKPGSQGFGFKIDYERSADTMNNYGGGGHHIRFYPVRDHTGAIIPNTYFMCLDYSPGAGAVGENFDFQDQVYVISNVKPNGL
jgi:hypothetical protein